MLKHVSPIDCDMLYRCVIDAYTNGKRNCEARQERGSSTGGRRQDRQAVSSHTQGPRLFKLRLLNSQSSPSVECGVVNIGRLSLNVTSLKVCSKKCKWSSWQLAVGSISQVRVQLQVCRGRKHKKKKKDTKRV